ncbi:MAG: hypothetical protein H5T61_13020 [Thermoflexales bacterium]|nr:hypothetical protein [Thermoflexales bacterium]
MRKCKMLVLAAVLVCSMLLVSVALANGSPAIDWSVIGGGGGHAEAAPYALDSTIGQPVAGRVAYSPYDLCSGFWCGVAGYKVYLPLVLRNY